MLFCSKMQNGTPQCNNWCFRNSTFPSFRGTTSERGWSLERESERVSERGGTMPERRRNDIVFWQTHAGIQVFEHGIIFRYVLKKYCFVYCSCIFTDFMKFRWKHTHTHTISLEFTKFNTSLQNMYFSYTFTDFMKFQWKHT